MDGWMDRSTTRDTNPSPIQHNPLPTPFFNWKTHAESATTNTKHQTQKTKHTGELPQPRVLQRALLSLRGGFGDRDAEADLEGQKRAWLVVVCGMVGGGGGV